MITVIIPTYNRPKCIEYIFQKCIKNYTGAIFEFELHDSSEGEETKKLFAKYSKICTQVSVRYIHYERKISGDDKAILAIENNVNDYFWLMGDGNVVDFNNIEKLLSKNNFQKFDVLNIETLDRMKKTTKNNKLEIDKIYEFSNYIGYAERYFSHLTYWGASIIKNSFFRVNYKNGVVKKYQSEKIPWWIACLIFEACYEKGNVLLGTVYSQYVQYNPMKKDHGWTNGDRYYEYTFKKFNRAVELMPNVYIPVKKRIIRSFRMDALVTNGYLIRLKGKGVLRYKLIKKYKAEINNIKGFYWKMILISCIPRNIAFLIYEIKQFINIKYRRLQ